MQDEAIPTMDVFDQGPCDVQRHGDGLRFVLQAVRPPDVPHPFQLPLGHPIVI